MPVIVLVLVMQIIKDLKMLEFILTFLIDLKVDF